MSRCLRLALCFINALCHAPTFKILGRPMVKDLGKKIFGWWLVNLRIVQSQIKFEWSTTTPSHPITTYFKIISISLNNSLDFLLTLLVQNSFLPTSSRWITMKYYYANWIWCTCEKPNMDFCSQRSSKEYRRL